MADTAASLKEENARLHARIRRLEARLRDAKLEGDEHSLDETSDIARELPNRAMDELARLTRGVVGAYVEQVKLSAEFLNEFATELSERNRPTEKTSAQAFAGNLPRDVFAGVVKALDKSLTFPSRTIQSFVDNYNAPIRKSEDAAGDGDDTTTPSAAV
jgi:hypothetical protein